VPERYVDWQCIDKFQSNQGLAFARAEGTEVKLLFSLEIISPRRG
jgi:hypothetical protein